MPRPRKLRRICLEPNITYFKPRGIPLKKLEESILKFEELEAIRIKDLEKIEQKKAARKMKVSQPTFSRIIESARKKIADALINGKAIKIQGGKYTIVRRRRFRRRR